MFARLAVMLLAALALVAAAPPAGTPQERRIAALIDKLGEDDFDTREAAHKELTRIGKPAVAQLMRAARLSADLEIRRRAAKILEAVDPGAMARARRAQRGQALARRIAEVQHGTDATTWGESIANPFTALSEEGKKKLRAEGIEVDRLLKMRARLITGTYCGSLSKTFVNLDPDVILVFGKGFKTHDEVHSVGPVLAVEDAHFMSNIRGASLVWCVDKSFPRSETSGMPLVLAPSAELVHMRKVDDEVLHGDYGWKAPKDLCKPLLEATKDDPPATRELAAERKRLSAQIKKVKGLDVKDHAKQIANPFTNLTDEGTKKLTARGVDVVRLARLKRTLYLTGDHWSKVKPFVNADPDTILVLGKDFRTGRRCPVYSLGPVVAVDNASLFHSELTGADLVWFVDTSHPSKVTGAPVILQPSAILAIHEGSKHVWHGDYGWRRPKDWPVATKKD
jgi:hypothetical protein